MKNKHWFDVYPQGTPEGEKEQKVFISLARDPKIIWKTTRALYLETGLSETEIEHIIDKYLKINMIIKNPENDYEWAYYERVENLPKPKLSVTEENQKKRIKEN